MKSNDIIDLCHAYILRVVDTIKHFSAIQLRNKLVSDIKSFENHKLVG